MIVILVIRIDENTSALKTALSSTPGQCTKIKPEMSIAVATVFLALKLP